MIRVNVLHSKKFWILAIAIVLGLVWSSNRLYQHYFIPSTIDALSISSDGRYVISTGERELAVLWDVRHKNYKIIGHHAHIFSAYFIPGTHNFIWQNQNKTIFIENVNGKVIKKFQAKYFVRGQVMTKDMKYYMFGDIGDGIHWCESFKCKVEKEPMSKDPNEYIDDKPYNMDMTKDGKYVIGTSITGWEKQIVCNSKKNCNKLKSLGTVLWDFHKGKPIRNFNFNSAKTYAIFNPSGKYIVSVDEDSLGFVINRKTGKQLFRLWDLYYGKWLGKKSNPAFDDTGLIKAPKYFDDAAIAVKFIDKDHYFRFSIGEPYVVLYHLKKPQPLKYLNLGKKPMPSVEFYQLNLSIDTAPKAHILVMGKAWEGGILVYKYDPRKQTLTKIWDGK